MRKLTTEEFIEQARIVHGAKYDYSQVFYNSSRTKVHILCPIHGIFEQKANNHLNGQGCSKCSGKSRLNKEAFLDKIKLVHGNIYDYSKVNYANSKTKVTIICHTHGEFEQTPHNHLLGQGCPSCAGNISLNTEEFIVKAKTVHGDKYNYTRVSYNNAGTKVTITCLTHGDFEQTPASHLIGRGCPSCAKTGFDPNKPGTLYYLKITTNNNQVLYKIGITNKTVNKRFSLKDLASIEILKQKLYENGQDAYDLEQGILKTYKQYQYIGPAVLESGNTEVFTENVLNLIDSW